MNFEANANMIRAHDCFVAKTTLAEIGQKFTGPHLLVGSLAVEQYCLARNSKEIDLICDHKARPNILRELFHENK